jgi:hypothetical protein
LPEDFYESFELATNRGCRVFSFARKMETHYDPETIRLQVQDFFCLAPALLICHDLPLRGEGK